MDALVFDQEKGWEETRGFTKVSVPEPTLEEPKDAEMIIVKLSYAGVCGSDRGIWFRESFRDMIQGSLHDEQKNLRIIGHEFFGYITAVGSSVESQYHLQVGDAVTAESHISCGQCFQCKNGERHVCVSERILGISIDGCFSEYIKLPAKVAWKTDTKKIRPEVACLQEPFGNAVHACSKVDIRGKRVVIFGCGPVGLYTILIARAQGASTIICVDPNPDRTHLILACGADHVLGTRTDTWHHDPLTVSCVMDLTQGVGADVVFEMAGYNGSINNALQSVRRGGSVVLFGLKSGDLKIEDFDRMIVRGITLHAVIGRQIFQTWETTKALFEDTKNGIQEKLWAEILSEGRDTIVPFAEYDTHEFEKKMLSHPKILFSF